jgi:hypothetical protein
MLSGPVFRHVMEPFDQVGRLQDKRAAQKSQVLHLLGRQHMEACRTHILRRGHSFLPRTTLRAADFVFAFAMGRAFVLGSDNVAGA